MEEDRLLAPWAGGEVLLGIIAESESIRVSGGGCTPSFDPF